MGEVRLSCAAQQTEKHVCVNREGPQDSVGWKDTGKLYDERQVNYYQKVRVNLGRNTGEVTFSSSAGVRG